MMIIPKAKKFFMLDFLPLSAAAFSYFASFYQCVCLHISALQENFCLVYTEPNATVRNTLLTRTQEKIWINDSWFTFCGFWINLHNGGWKINFIHIKCVYNSGFHSFEEKKGGRRTTIFVCTTRFCSARKITLSLWNF